MGLPPSRRRSPLVYSLSALPAQCRLRHSRAHARGGAGQPPERAGLPGRLAAGCAATAPHVRRRRRRLAGDVHVPAGSWEYKAALNGSWDENYGANAQRNGANIGARASAPRPPVKFYYSHETHWITDNRNAVIAVAPGQLPERARLPGRLAARLPALLAPGPGRRRHLHLPHAASLPAGNYEVKVAINESWDENYGAGRRPERRQHPVHRGRRLRRGRLHLRRRHPRAHRRRRRRRRPQPRSVTIAGQPPVRGSDCSGDWQPDCAGHPPDVRRRPTASGRGPSTVPAGSWEYKAALNDSWDENYGAERHAQRPEHRPRASPRPRRSSSTTSTRPTGSPDNRNAVIAVAPGSFQSELGCPGDWQPDCLRSWLQDPDGDGIYTLPHQRAARRRLRGARWRSTRAGTRTTARAACRTAPTSPSPCPPPAARCSSATTPSTHVLTVSAEGAPRGNLAPGPGALGDARTRSPGTRPAFRPDWTVTLHYDADGGLTLGPRASAAAPTSRSPTTRPGLSAELEAAFPHLAELRRLQACRRPAGRGARGPQGPARGVGARTRGGTPGGRHRRCRSRACSTTSTPTTGRSAPPSRHGAPDPARLGAHGALGQAPPVRRLEPPTTADRARMTLDPATGVWSVTGSAGWNGRYYLYEVEVFVALHRPGGAQPGHRSVLGQPLAQQPAQPDRRPRDRGLQAAGLGRACASRRSTRPRTSSSTSCTCATSAPATRACPPTLRGTFKAFTLRLARHAPPARRWPGRA